MPPLRIVEHLDVMKHSLPGIIPGLVFDAPDFLLLQVTEKTFSHCVVPTVPLSTHARFNVECREQFPEMATAVLRSLVGMKLNLLFRLTAPEGSCQCIKNQVICYSITH